MANDEQLKQMDGTKLDQPSSEEQLQLSRRDFLAGLRKWSAAVIGVAVVGGIMAPAETDAGWINGRGGWLNAVGGGGWINRGGSWINGHVGGGSWINRRGW